MTFKNFLFAMIAAAALMLVGCEDKCKKTCKSGQVLTAECKCVPKGTDCTKKCKDGEILTIDCKCVPGQAPEKTVTVKSNITKDTKWTKDKIWILDTRVTVMSGATLTIEPGTIVKGAAGSGANSTALLVARGGKLNAAGTADKPIIFTTVADEITPENVASGKYSPNLKPTVNGLWGGIIVLGKAKISAKKGAKETQIDGIPTSDRNGLYGGDNNEDNSGVIKYVSIRHGGTNIGAGNEINGLTLGGVGSKTVIENIEVVANQDDGVEWFGGSVSAKNVLVWNCGDDGLDTDQAWNGKCENFIVATPRGGSAMELDGPEGDLTQGPNTFNNGIIYAGNEIDHLVDWDDNTNTGITNLYIFGLDKDYKEGLDKKGKVFLPVESFGGDKSAPTNNWEYTLADNGATYEQVFKDVPTSIMTEVTPATYTKGPKASVFAWSLAGKTNALKTLGIK